MLLPKNKEEEQGKEVEVGRGCDPRGTVEIRVEFLMEISGGHRSF